MGFPPWVKFAYLVLVANGLPAFIILMSLPGQTQNWFVWTVKPEASARLLGAMYGNALMLVVLGIIQPNWARITVVVISLFSVAATVVTFLHLGPFMQHPWVHFAYWLSMYVILFFLAPAVFLVEEQTHGGPLPVEMPLSQAARGVALVSCLGCAITALGLFIGPPFISSFWPWNLTPLVSRILGVWFGTLAVAYAWSLWDGDWLRTRLIFWQAFPTGLLLALVPALHARDLREGATAALTLYLVMALGAGSANLLVALLAQRTARLAIRRAAS